MITLMSPVAVLCAVVALAAGAWRLASERDRLPELWTALSVAAAVGAGYGFWKWLGHAGSDAGMIVAGFGIWAGPLMGAGAVVGLLYLMPPGRPWIGRSVAVRVMDGESEDGQLELGAEELRLVTSKKDVRIPLVEVERMQADGECLRLALRGGGELRLQMVGVSDPRRRRRLCEALARSLVRQPVRARLRS